MTFSIGFRSILSNISSQCLQFLNYTQADKKQRYFGKEHLINKTIYKFLIHSTREREKRKREYRGVNNRNVEVRLTLTAKDKTSNCKK